jgi:hypothetical protein
MLSNRAGAGRWASLFLGLFFVVNQSFTQDLYDLGHSRSYAAHLMRSRQYTLAGEEYERLVFLQPTNDTFRVQLLKAYRLGGQTDRGLQTWTTWTPPTLALTPSRINTEYANLLLFSSRSADALAFAARPGALDSTTARRTQLYAQLLQQDWRAAQHSLEAWPGQQPLPYRPLLASLVESGQNQRYKSPALAAGLSTLVPGLGKVYTRNWKDGLISLVFVGLNGWQSYRRFHREGVDSAWGWVHGGFATGFYLGNIYGSHKAARVFNQRQRDHLQHETERLLFPTLD